MMKRTYPFSGPKNLDRGLVIRHKSTFTVCDEDDPITDTVTMYLETLPSLIAALQTLQNDWLAEQGSAGRYVCGSGEAGHIADAWCPRDCEEG